MIRCRKCRAEQILCGPSTMPFVTEPGWQIDVRSFYTPSGWHYCPEHVTESWVAWCSEGVVLECHDDLDVNAPHGLTEYDVIVRLGERRCSKDHEYVGAERRADFYPFPDVEL